MNAELEIKRALRQIGVNGGDTIMVHTSMKAVFGLADFKSGDEAAALLLKCFMDVLGPQGTLVVPAFNYDFGEGGVYIHESSPSQVGLFTNYVLRHPDSLRSFHPILSCSVLGPMTALSNVSRSSYGKGSIFEKLLTVDAGLVFFNTTCDSMTFIHYVEQLIGVSYREVVEISGKVSRGGEARDYSINFYARRPGVKVQMSRLHDTLLRNGSMRMADLGGHYPVFHVKCRAVMETVKERLKNNPWFLIEELYEDIE